MNLSKILFLLGLILFTNFQFQSCKKDPCKSTVCLNGGVCDDGSCQCPTGYSGPQCENFDPCSTITCYNGGTCANGQCNCPTGYTGSDCGTALTPTSLTITKIDLYDYPMNTTSGGGWDISTGPDPYISISLGQSYYSSDWVTNYYTDLTGSAVSYTLTTPKTLTNMSSYYTVGLWDHDDPDADDGMGGIYFIPNNYKSGFPSTITLKSTSLNLEYKLHVTWNF